MPITPPESPASTSNSSSSLLDNKATPGVIKPNTVSDHTEQIHLKMTKVRVSYNTSVICIYLSSLYSFKSVLFIQQSTYKMSLKLNAFQANCCAVSYLFVRLSVCVCICTCLCSLRSDQPFAV